MGYDINNCKREVEHKKFVQQKNIIQQFKFHKNYQIFIHQNKTQYQ